MTIFILLLAAALFVAYVNGANDNFKGVATLYGSGTTGYWSALGWATLTTLAGSLSSVYLSDKLVKAFSAKGLVPAGIAAAPEFLTAVALGAALTIFLATMTGFPISTTHALTGGLVGAGIAAAGGSVNFSLLQALSWPCSWREPDTLSFAGHSAVQDSIEDGVLVMGAGMRMSRQPRALRPIASCTAIGILLA